MKEGKYLQLQWNNGLELRKGKFRLGCSKKFLTQIALDSKRSFFETASWKISINCAGETLWRNTL